MKTIIERGASWTMDETNLLLRLWGKDYVERQSTGAKRTKEVYEQIADQFNELGHERTADQVRTRIFNMIAEYRRIRREGNPEREKKCIFFAKLHKIYEARHMEDVEVALMPLDDYEPDFPFSPSSQSVTVLSGADDESISDGEATDGNESESKQIATKLGALTDSKRTTATNDGTNNTNTSNKNNSKAGSKDGDSNNNNNEKESSSNSSHHHHHHQRSGASVSAKKMKLESPKASNQLNQSATTSSSMQNSHSDDVNLNSKERQKSGAAVTNNSTVGAAVAAMHSTSSLPNPATASTSSSAAASSSSSSSSSAPRHQSLLMPHATSATPSTSSTTASTPISKLTTSGSNNTPSYININSTKLPIIRTNQLIGHSNGNESINLNGTATRLPTTAAITSHQLYQAPVNTFDVTSSALLIDRMFAHLSRESENMREWIALEKERLALERTRRQQDADREVRRERVLIDTLMKFQEQWLSFLTRLDPRILENITEHPPELKIPAKEATPVEASQTSAANSTATPPDQP